jgi:hypothetical protein
MMIVKQEILGAVIYELPVSIFCGGKKNGKSSFARNLSRGKIETHSLWGTRAGKTRCAAKGWKPN